MVSLKMKTLQPKNNNPVIDLQIEQMKPFVIVIGVIGFVLTTLIIGFFGVFLYKRKRARQELEGFLSLSLNQTDTDGGTIYFGKEENIEKQEVKDTELEDSLEED